METTVKINQIRQQVEIQWPVKALFNYVADINNNPEWQSNVIRSEWINRTGNRVGSTFAEIRKVRGEESFTEIRETEFIPDRKRTIKINTGVEVLCSMHFVPLSDQKTRLTLQVKWNKDTEPDDQFNLVKLKEVLEREDY
jgi:hypothetical protein